MGRFPTVTCDALALPFFPSSANAGGGWLSILMVVAAEQYHLMDADAPKN